MKIFLIALTLAGAPAAGAPEQQKLTKEQAEGIARLVSSPVTEVIRPAAIKAVEDATKWSNAAAWALWDLAQSLAQPQAGQANLTETYLRLSMRCNTGDLCPKRGAVCKAYPGDAEFAAAARHAGEELAAFAAGLKGRKTLKRADRDRLAAILNTARKRAIFPLRVTTPQAAEPTPPTQQEETYLRLALEKKKGTAYAQPPWQ